MDGFWFHYSREWISEDGIWYVDSSLFKRMLYYHRIPFRRMLEKDIHIRYGCSRRSRPFNDQIREVIALERLARACEFVGDGACGRIKVPLSKTDKSKFTLCLLYVPSPSPPLCIKVNFFPLNSNFFFFLHSELIAFRRRLRVITVELSGEEQIPIPSRQDFIHSRYLYRDPSPHSKFQSQSRFFSDEQERLQELLSECLTPAQRDGVKLAPKTVVLEGAPSQNRIRYCN